MALGVLVKAGIPRRRHRHPREDRRQDVRVGVGVVEFQLKALQAGDSRDRASLQYYIVTVTVTL